MRRHYRLRGRGGMRWRKVSTEAGLRTWFPRTKRRCDGFQLISSGRAWDRCAHLRCTFVRDADTCRTHDNAMSRRRGPSDTGPNARKTEVVFLARRLRLVDGLTIAKTRPS